MVRGLQALNDLLLDAPRDECFRADGAADRADLYPIRIGNTQLRRMLGRNLAEEFGHQLG